MLVIIKNINFSMDFLHTWAQQALGQAPQVDHSELDLLS
jgi:hypothetical protein